MKHSLLAATALVAAALASPPTRATQLLDATPLAAVVTAQPRDCAEQSPWRMPVITWGADAVTLFANGGARTQAGSLIGKAGLDVSLQLVNDFTAQVRDYESCASPFLRATFDMLGQAADITERDPRTRAVVIYQHSWSAGGDTLVARSDIRQPSDLKGHVVVLQQYGPHLYYLLRILADAGLKPSDVTIRFTRDLTGGGAETPMAAMQTDGSVAAALVISPDAATLTSGGGGAVGTGAEGSVKGARTLLSTRTANRVITDVIAVREDFYAAHTAQLSALGRALYAASDRLRGDAGARNPEWAGVLRLAAQDLLGDPQASADTQGLWDGAEISDRQGNARFFADPNYPRGFDAVGREIAGLLQDAGLVRAFHQPHKAGWDWAEQTNVRDVTAAPAPAFDNGAASRVVTNLDAQGTEADQTLFAFSIPFGNNQKSFTTGDYDEAFRRVVKLASTYAGAVITVEGHADPQALLQAQASGRDHLILTRLAQSAKNLSLQRAQAVRDAVIAWASAHGITLDPSQFVVVGMGYDHPATGMCGDFPCAPRNEEEARRDRAVNFNVVNVEAETDAFAPTR